MSFYLIKKNLMLSFFEIEVYSEKVKFVTTAYRKPNFRGVYIHFESFIQI